MTDDLDIPELNIDKVTYYFPSKSDDYKTLENLFSEEVVEELKNEVDCLSVFLVKEDLKFVLYTVRARFRGHYMEISFWLDSVEELRDPDLFMKNFIETIKREKERLDKL